MNALTLDTDCNNDGGKIIACQTYVTYDASVAIGFDADTDGPRMMVDGTREGVVNALRQLAQAAESMARSYEQGAPA